MTGRALDEVSGILEGGSEPDDALRSVVRVLVDEPGIAWAAIAFLEEGELVVGPQAGDPDERRRARVPVAYQGRAVGELWVDGEADPQVLERIAALISTHVLVGWDTSGERWQP